MQVKLEFRNFITVYVFPRSRTNLHAEVHLILEMSSTIVIFKIFYLSHAPPLPILYNPLGAPAPQFEKHWISQCHLCIIQCQHPFVATLGISHECSLKIFIIVLVQVGKAGLRTRKKVNKNIMLITKLNTTWNSCWDWHLKPVAYQPCNSHCCCQGRNERCKKKPQRHLFQQNLYQLNIYFIMKDIPGKHNHKGSVLRRWNCLFYNWAVFVIPDPSLFFDI